MNERLIHVKHVLIFNGYSESIITAEFDERGPAFLI